MIKIFPNIQNFISFSGFLDLTKIASINLGCFQNEVLAQEFSVINHNFSFIKTDADIECIKNDFEEEKYEIEIKDKIKISAGSIKGILYAVQTLKQIFKHQEVEKGIITDYPDLKIRAAMIDISRDKVPTLETLKSYVDNFLSLKINQIQLYVEGFSFEYKSFEDFINIDKNYITLNDYLELQKYCNDRCIDFVPNQNGFGHMAEWLTKDKFNNLAESPDGAVYWGSHRDPATLDPSDEGSYNLVKKMYADMLPYTTSKYFNMNFDEPMELGMGKSKALVEKEGEAKVYLDYFKKLYEVVITYGKTPMMWGDVLIKHPEVMDEIPKDIIFLDWGYDHRYDFNAHAKLLKEHNIPFMFAPGTSTWAAVTSKYVDMYGSITHAARAAKKYGALGMIITDWGDFGHLQYIPSSIPGFILASCVAWSNIDEADLEEAINLYEPNLGKNILDLCLVSSIEGEYLGYGCRMFSPIMFAALANSYEDKTSFFVEKMKHNLIDEYCENKVINYLNKQIDELNKINPSTSRDEMLNAAFLLKTLTTFNGNLRDHIKGKKVGYDQVLSDFKVYKENHQKLWFSRNVKEGFNKSILKITNLIQIIEDLNRKETL